MNRSSIILLSTVVLLIAACAGVDRPEDTRTPAAPPGATIAYLLVDLDSGAMIADEHRTTPMIPASTVKLATAIAALDILGPNYRFATRIGTVGKITDGVLDGNLYLIGGGDPLLSIQDLMALTQQLRDRGLKKVTGRFIYDEAMIASSPEINPRQPLKATYNAGVSALSLDFNRSQRTARPVRDPARRTAVVFGELATQLGLQLPPAEPGTTPLETHSLAHFSSKTLAEVLRPALEFSNNVVSELIGRVAAGHLPGDIDKSSKILTDWLKARNPEIDWHSLNLPNHSGLSEQARMTPIQAVAVLRYGLARRYNGWSILSLLPATGWRKAFAGRFTDPLTRNRVWAKTGTMNYAKGLLGVMFSDAGKQIVFALYVTDFSARAAYDADPERQAPASQTRALDWISRAETFVENLVGSWIKIH